MKMLQWAWAKIIGIGIVMATTGLIDRVCL